MHPVVGACGDAGRRAHPASYAWVLPHNFQFVPWVFCLECFPVHACMYAWGPGLRFKLSQSGGSAVLVCHGTP